MPGSVTTRTTTGVGTTAEFDRSLRAVEEVGPLAAEQAGKAEAQRFLTEPVVEALRDTGLTAVLVPSELGGAGLTLPEAIEVFRAMAEFDASTAWTLAILANGGLFGRFLARTAFEELLDGGALLAGSLNPLAATAVPAAGGIRVSGRAPYASGCHHARWLLVAGWMYRDGERSFIDGVPELVASILPIGQATITDSWHTSGMRGTGSNDCLVDDVFVPDAFTFRWVDPQPQIGADGWNGIPMMVQIGAVLSPSVVGAGRAARHHFAELAGVKRPLGSVDLLADRAYAHVGIGRAEGLLLAAEDTLAAAADDVWRQGEAGMPFEDADRARLRARVVTAVALAAESVDVVHDVSGMSAVTAGSALERVWRDVHTASQHVNLNVARFETIGRIVLGREPGSPVI